MIQTQRLKSIKVFGELKLNYYNIMYLLNNIIKMNKNATKIYNKIIENNQRICDANKLIYKCKENNKELRKKLFASCDHEWIYDEWANFDDRCKYICKHCRLYKNPHYN